MKEIRYIHAVSSAKYIEKLSKYVVELEFHGNPKHEFWLTEKQFDGLCKAVRLEILEQNLPVYSNKNNPAYAVFEQRGQYLNFVWASSDRAWLAKAFDVAEDSENEAAEAAQGE